MGFSASMAHNNKQVAFTQHVRKVAKLQKVLNILVSECDGDIQIETTWMDSSPNMPIGTH